MKNRIALRVLLMLAAIMSAVSLPAMNDASLEKPDFVLAVFATHRARADMLEKAGAQNILAYNINSESTIDISSKVVKNVWTRAQNKWVRVEQVPLPDVVYDFGVYKKSREKKETARLLKKQLRDHKIPFINPDEEMNTVNDKVLFSQIMRANNIPHPETQHYSRSRLKKMLAKHDILFIKPVFGSKGFGIIVVEKTIESGNVQYAVTHKFKRRGKWVSLRTEGLSKRKVRKAIYAAQDKLKKRNARYLIQEGVKVHRYDTQQTDFRVNVQRGDGGQIQSAGFFMRVGGNISQGGRAADYRVVLNSLEEKSGIDVETIRQRVENVAVNSQLALEKHAGKMIGELGIDLVVTERGDVYVIEANNKSGYMRRHLQRNPLNDMLFDLPPFYQEAIKLDAAHEDHIISYARHLATQK